eukprot:TRINITY_DN561_c0_g1_i1.p1 TRINITY_DN561_c0_g1~~TRINITY_DN561_c0_g1_i1.p1  ORF type:complete len:192 (+),score=51.92 TRINITY_DN561_c0_g1_i1:108-683(+)
MKLFLAVLIAVVIVGCNCQLPETHPYDPNFSLQQLCRGFWVLTNNNTNSVDFKWSFRSNVTKATNASLAAGQQAYFSGGGNKVLKIWRNWPDYNMTDLIFFQKRSTTGRKCFLLFPSCNGQWKIENLVPTSVTIQWASSSPKGNSAGSVTLPARGSSTITTPGGGTDEQVSLSYLNKPQGVKRGLDNTCPL